MIEFVCWLAFIKIVTQVVTKKKCLKKKNCSKKNCDNWKRLIIEKDCDNLKRL